MTVEIFMDKYAFPSVLIAFGVAVILVHLILHVLDKIKKERHEID